MNTHDLHISQRLKATLPPLTEHEREQLEANIVADGEVFGPILWWNDGKRKVVVDGMHRWEIIHRLGLTKFEIKEAKAVGSTYEEAAKWVFDHYDGGRHASREAIGKWYNDMKATWGGKERFDAPKGSSAPLGSTAEKIAEKAGVSPATVKRDGARVEALEKCIPALQKQADKITDADAKTLAKLSPEVQKTVADDLRMTRAKTAKESMEKHKITLPVNRRQAAKLNGDPPPKKKAKPGKKFDKPALYKEWGRTIGPLMRLLDRIGREVGEPESKSKKAILGQLEICTEEMAEWMQVRS